MSGAANTPGTLSPTEAWQELVEYDDRTSPEEYPDMALITFDELREFMERGAGDLMAELLEAAERMAATRSMSMGDVMRRWPETRPFLAQWRTTSFEQLTEWAHASLRAAIAKATGAA